MARLEPVKYENEERVCEVLINSAADAAIAAAGAQRFVAVVDPANPNLHRLQAALEELWADVVGPEDAFDDEFGDFDDEDDFDDGGMLVTMEQHEMDGGEGGDDEAWDPADDDDAWDEAGEIVLEQMDDDELEFNVMARVEHAAVLLLREHFPNECNPEFGGAVLRGAHYSNYQVPDCMFRGASRVGAPTWHGWVRGMAAAPAAARSEQPNYAEFVHRDIDTCNPPRNLKAAMPDADAHSYRFYNLWVARTAVPGQIDDTGQVSQDPVVVLLPRDGGRREWDFTPPAQWDSHRLQSDAAHTFVAGPFLIFDSSDLWHGAVDWWDDAQGRVLQTPATQSCGRESIELRFRCRCRCGEGLAAAGSGGEGSAGAQLSPITYAYRHGHIGDSVHRVGGQAYDAL